MRVWPSSRSFLAPVQRYVVARKDASDQVIGQFAVRKTGSQIRFLEGLSLDSASESEWVDAISAVLLYLGPGTYIYGSDWSTEPSREGLLKRIRGVRVSEAEHHVVELVDFKRWPDWPSYLRAISANVRRNAAKAAKTHPKWIIDYRKGRSGLWLTWKLMGCRSRMYERKGVDWSAWKLPLSHWARLTFLPEMSVSAVLRDGCNALASFAGLETANRLYYFEGGTASPDGTGWLLILEILEHFHRRCPHGQFVMGSVPGRLEQRDGAWASDVRHRRDLRVEAYPTSVVTFDYAPVE
jgi:hypothetical protein